MKILITGSNGLLGQKVLSKALEENFEVIATSKGVDRLSMKNAKNYIYCDLDITNQKDVFCIIQKFKPQVIINTAALTNVDLCEDDQQLCDAVNVQAVKYLVEMCAKFNIHLIHISTDFIFDGKHGPYSELDIPNPLSYYGISKLKSEKLLTSSDINWTILRTIILFGVGQSLSRNNLILWAKHALENNQDLNIIDDQFRAPTLAEDLADACISAAKKKVYGIFHVSGKDIMSIFDIVKSIAKFFKLSTDRINKINSSVLNQKAIRPTKTGFVLDKAMTLLNYNPHSFNDSLEVIKTQLIKK